MIWVNGEPADSIPANDRGLHYGDGVWETIAIHKGRALQLDAHLLRLQRGLDVLAINNLDREQLKQEVELFIKTHRYSTDNTKDNTQDRSILKVIITRGSGGRGYSPQGCSKATRIVSQHPWPSYPASYAKTGVDVTLCKTRLSHNPQLAGFKHLNRLEQVLARAELDPVDPHPKFQESLVMDYDNHVIEATMSNLFIVNNDQTIVTPDLSQCGIEGIARSCIISELQEMGIEVSILNLSVDDVLQAKGLFLSNSIIKIWPVKRFQQTIYEIPASVQQLQKRIQGRL